MSKKPSRPHVAATPAQPDAQPGPAAQSEGGFNGWSGKIAVGVAIVAFVVLCGLADNPVTWPVDSFSDLNVLMSADNFGRFGLGDLHLLPVHYFMGQMSADPDYYIHYPPLPNVVAGVLRSAGVESVPVMRGFCAALFVVGLYLMFRALAPVIGAAAAVCGLAFVCTSRYLLDYGVSVHTHGYNTFFMGLFFLLLLPMVERDDWKRWRPLAGAWAALMLGSLASFEFILYPQIFAWVYVLARGRIRKLWPVLLILATAPIFGVGLHLLQNVWALGWDRAVGDGMGYGMYTAASDTRWVAYGKAWDNIIAHSQELYFWSWPILVIAGVIALGLRNHSEPAESGSSGRPRAGALLLAVTLAAMGWYILIPTHTYSHPHGANQFFPLVFVATGGVLGVLVRWLLTRQTAVPIRILAGLGLLSISVIQGQAVTRTFKPRGDGALVMLARAMGDGALPENVGVLTNAESPPFLAYFIRRPTWRSPDWPSWRNPFPKSVWTLPRHLPDGWPLKYYLFYGRGNRDALNDLLAYCPGEMLAATRPDARPEDVMAAVQQGLYFIRFDITPMQKPREQWQRLPDEVQQRQRMGVFPEWKVEGFHKRLMEILARQPS
jgi:hypothetical protein